VRQLSYRKYGIVETIAKWKLLIKIEHMLPNKIVFIVASILMMLMLGSVYSWSIIRVSVEADFNVSATQSGFPYMISLSSYALSMLVSGKLMKRFQIWVVLSGALLFSLGLFLSSLVTTISLLTLTYGVLVGTGVGMLYGVPLYVINQTFPNRVGFFSGLVLLGFGFSSVIMAPIIEILLLTTNVSTMFSTLSLIAILVFSFALIPLLQPITPLADRSSLPTPIHKPTFTYLYVLFLLSLISGLMIIGLTYRIGVINYEYDGVFVTFLLTMFAIANAVARPLFGWIIDQKNIFFAGTLSLTIIASSALIAIINQGQLTWLFALNYGVFWFGLGSWVSIAPLAVKKLFGAHNYAHLYGFLFTAYGVAAILGTLFSGAILDLFNSTIPLYALIISINLFNFIVLRLLKKSTLRLK
jgi:MFS transporter, OFA family, oxalate/formate antiporter